MHMRMFTALPTILSLAIFLHLASSSFTKGVEGAENSIIRCIETERQALLAFKQSIMEDNGMLSSWGSHKECCKWWGVGCNNATGHVIRLDLHGNSSTHHYLSAPKVSPSLLQLKHLNNLDLSYNDFQWSSIPEFIGSFQRLRVLNLENANFAGAIPPHLGNLTNLRILLLSHNGLNETIAELLEKLARGETGKSLQILGLSGNELTGKLPANMSNRFESLREFYARQNLMSGYLPLLPSSLEQLDLAINNFGSVFQNPNKGFGKPSNLMKLDLSYNLISGPFPDLSDFLSLRVLNLSGNLIQGGLSESIGKLPKLQVFRAKANSLEGVISEAHFWNLSSIQKMDLSLNPGLSFNFSDDWVPPFHTLNSLVLANCKVGPKFPKWLQNQSLFSEIDLSSASISDTLPHWFWDLISPNLRYLNLSYNSIDGTLPDLSNKLSPFSIIDLSFNKFWGPISKFVGDFLILNLSNNKFVGSISFLCSVISQNALCIDLSYNHFSGEVPDCWNSNISNLAIINFANNGFSGEIPNSLGSLSQLQSLHLRSNNFNGELPSSFQNFKSLKVMDLEGNKFIGTIPTWIGSYLTNLTVLSLRNNNFNESMPESLCHLKNIHFLDLSQNKVTGRIPSCFNNFTTLIQSTPFTGSIEISYFTITGDIDYPAYYVDDVFVQWKNKDAKFNKQLGFLNCIDLSSNKLSGNIPEELYALKEVVSLNLSRNHLTGKIFPSIYEMENLESLDLSRNQLSGEIPSSLALLTFLGVLDLSNNFLSGKIPKGTQLQTFNASSYAGNSGLCGDPLPKCPTDDVPSHGKNNNYKEGDDNLVDREFYISMVLGFSISFWGLLVSLVLSDKWRLAYYGFFNDVKDGLYVNMKICLKRLQQKFVGT
ncbi:receptor-like protein EIX2 [Ipomoea triloba]|uniref:receptor-like protein EIX2 n=1 Tax=Ipomoea triloba TaxID=35885 RepID=UPI00125D7479|nr:receptor-like protein EIX2 [Ipomoea triloba]